MKIKKLLCVHTVACGMNFHGKTSRAKTAKSDRFYYYADKYFLKELNSTCNFVNKISSVSSGRKSIKLIIQAEFKLVENVLSFLVIFKNISSQQSESINQAGV